jgi:putative spermidine/putrescine transport system substrate-binding protein
MTASAKPLVVMSWAGGWLDSLQRTVSAAFERETGVRVHHEVNIGLALPQRLLDSLAAGERPPFDVVWCNSVPAFECAQRGFCRELDDQRIPVLRELRARAFPEGLGRGPRGTPLIHPYVVYYVLAYHRGRIPNAPDSWATLLDDRFANKVAIYPGGNGIYPIAQVMGGGRVETIPDDMEACWAWLTKLLPRLGALDYSIGMGPRLRSGDLDLCFRALTNALAFRAEGIDVAWCVPAEGTTDTMDSLFVPTGVPEETAYLAERYIEISTRADVQAAWCARLGAMPVHPAAAVPGCLLEHPRLPNDADQRTGLHVPEIVKFAHQRAWEERFGQLLRVS